MPSIGTSISAKINYKAQILFTWIGILIQHNIMHNICRKL